tara:strand:- start:134 stop:352 length:219 start_codon:yes stop_codon:yes gene_type:complete
MVKKGEILNNSVISIINNYRNFLNTEGRGNEASLIRIYLSKCDVTDKPEDPDADNLMTTVKNFGVSDKATLL